MNRNIVNSAKLILIVLNILLWNSPANAQMQQFDTKGTWVTDWSKSLKQDSEHLHGLNEAWLKSFKVSIDEQKIHWHDGSIDAACSSLKNPEPKKYIITECKRDNGVSAGENISFELDEEDGWLTYSVSDDPELSVYLKKDGDGSNKTSIAASNAENLKSRASQSGSSIHPSDKTPKIKGIPSFLFSPVYSVPDEYKDAVEKAREAAKPMNSIFDFRELKLGASYEEWVSFLNTQVDACRADNFATSEPIKVEIIAPRVDRYDSDASEFFHNIGRSGMAIMKR